MYIYIHAYILIGYSFALHILQSDNQTSQEDKHIV